MKPGNTFLFEHENKTMKIRAENLPLKESMDPEFKEIYFFESRAMHEESSIIVDGTEQDMVSMIMENPTVIEPGFRTVNNEEQTKYGFIDVLGYDKSGTLTVIECKRHSADLKAVDQLRRYVERIKTSKGITEVRGILASPLITGNALKMLEDWGFTHRRVDAPKRYEQYNNTQQKLQQFYEK